MCNLESWALESGLQLKESGIPLTSRIKYQNSTDWTQYLESKSKTVLDSLALFSLFLLERHGRKSAQAKVGYYYYYYYYYHYHYHYHHHYY